MSVPLLKPTLSERLKRFLPTKFQSHMSASQTKTLMLYLVAVAVYFALFYREFIAAWNFPNLLVAPIMAVGSFVAGATFLGGGAVAFPALTKILSTSPDVAKTFSLAIQSVGMTSAALYIVFRIKNIPWFFLAIYLPAAFVGLGISLSYLDSRLAPDDIRIAFTLFVLTFLLVYVWAYTNKDTHYLTLARFTWMDYKLIIIAGTAGGILSGLMGSGADVLAFCLLGLYFRLDLKLATQTSVLVMAANALVGTAMQGLVFNDISADVRQLWFIAAPVVIIGAPLGAVICRRIKPRDLLIFICSIASVELVSTLILVEFQPHRIKYYAIGAITSIVLLVLLNKLSHEKIHRGQRAVLAKVKSETLV
ncbi:sulfite exporter TauE/SafE family protein [Teredinibacter waterburyi]|uniref:sulfite exporter TauE/SafE family protein n=1 Tax=Teredinibacter waterburyi TaxID=1500538 RepID=UPI001FEB9C08|nr:sulfite exporter TauE/SafE family protein [Teredinibacter waterburyi]